MDHTSSHRNSTREDLHSAHPAARGPLLPFLGLGSRVMFTMMLSSWNVVIVGLYKTPPFYPRLLYILTLAAQCNGELWTLFHLPWVQVPALLLTVRQEYHVISLCLSFLHCKVKIIMVPTPWHWQDEMNYYMEALGTSPGIKKK